MTHKPAMDVSGQARVRADLLLVARGLFDTRARAQAAIRAGGVRADGRLVARPSDRLDPDCALEARPAFAWVSRGGLKLSAALDGFALYPAGRVCLDLGASTGGFTQVLLARGARHVTAVDVGRGQLHRDLHAAPGLTSLEGRDARGLTPGDLPEGPPDLIVADLSFIGLAKVLEAILPLAAARCDLVALVKPQFEIGPGGIGKGGLVPPDAAAAVARATADTIDGMSGFHLRALIESPVTGGDGNHEWLGHWSRDAAAQFSQ